MYNMQTLLFYRFIIGLYISDFLILQKCKLKKIVDVTGRIAWAFEQYLC